MRVKLPLMNHKQEKIQQEKKFNQEADILKSLNNDNNNNNIMLNC